MQWLVQNWIWIALGVGALFFISRMGGMGGCGIGRSRNYHHDASDYENAPPGARNRPGTLFDPVSGRSFAAGNAPFSTVYRGRGYYFETRENRDAFERDPERYVAGSAVDGQMIGTEDAHRDRTRRRGGC